MSKVELKISLHQLIDDVTDTRVLEAVYTLLSKATTNTEEDWYNSLSDEAKASIDRGLDDLKNGKTITHEVAMSRLKQRIAQYKNA